MDGWDRYYPIQTFPGLWVRLAKWIEKKEAQAIDEVLRELKRKDDALTAWSKKQKNLFIEVDDAIQLVVADILSKFPRLVESGGSRSGADVFVIALAHIHECTVVTGEKRASSQTGKLKIPDVCDTLHIRCITLLDLIKEQRWTFS